MNDGQDLKSLDYQKIMEELSRSQIIANIITVAIHAGERIQEYGVSEIPDYKGRGSKAGEYQEFLISEVFPLVEGFFKISLRPEKTAITGFSLGGLSAFDFAWDHPEKVSKVGVFSGSFWWRTRALGPDYQESDRIIHRKVESSDHIPQLKFWFQVGTRDEENDRNQNGVIDSIDDTLDLIKSLKSKGFSEDQDIRYIEVEGGEHNQKTWSWVLPQFLEWAFGSEER
jgi:enterochelin esterase-like enzyme